ncbi:NADP-dependent phosphogluconate dehydrogenase [Candidatus Peregrinibacteria bacterium]|nr:NADP-dependent phosphogluconate dehydrogenase [Candidatus Peregrinibacteria bacterium]
MSNADLGLIGLGIMGANLARNIANKGWNIVVFNRTEEKTKQFLKKFGNKNITGEITIETFVKKLKKPRKILLMVKAGEGVDEIVKKLEPFLGKGDIVTDLGNSNYKDTTERVRNLHKKRIHFLGCGISGGEKGALTGPSLMPGGDKKACTALLPFLKSISAKDFSGNPCVTYIGPDGSGHFVKMVHNGIEYGLMQILAEIYDILRLVYEMSAPEIANIFEKWGKNRLHSYLLTIAAEVLKKKDPLKKGFLIDAILDTAEQKGTGAWTVISAAEKGVPVPTIASALDARHISAEKDLRMTLAKKFPRPKKKAVMTEKILHELESALFGANILAYIQGYELMISASKEYGWEINLSEVTRIWQGGCIIRAKLLEICRKALKKNPQKHPMELDEIRHEFSVSMPDIKKIIKTAMEYGVPTPALSASFQYFLGMTREKLSANFIQALRDRFGAHTYERIDRTGTFHTPW